MLAHRLSPLLLLLMILISTSSARFCRISRSTAACSTGTLASTAATRALSRPRLAHHHHPAPNTSPTGSAPTTSPKIHAIVALSTVIPSHTHTPTHTHVTPASPL